jgi:hypothetical protein
MRVDWKDELVEAHKNALALDGELEASVCGDPRRPDQRLDRLQGGLEESQKQKEQEDTQTLTQRETVKEALTRPDCHGYWICTASFKPSKERPRVPPMPIDVFMDAKAHRRPNPG